MDDIEYADKDNNNQYGLEEKDDLAPFPSNNRKVLFTRIFVC